MSTFLSNLPPSLRSSFCWIAGREGTGQGSSFIHPRLRRVHGGGEVTETRGSGWSSNRGSSRGQLLAAYREAGLGDLDHARRLVRVRMRPVPSGCEHDAGNHARFPNTSVTQKQSRQSHGAAPSGSAPRGAECGFRPGFRRSHAAAISIDHRGCVEERCRAMGRDEARVPARREANRCFDEPRARRFFGPPSSSDRVR